MTFDVRIGTVSFNCPLSFIEALNNFGGGQDRYAVAAQSGNTLLELTLLDHQRYQGPPHRNAIA